jgi:hypothetical protein
MEARLKHQLGKLSKKNFLERRIEDCKWEELVRRSGGITSHKVTITIQKMKLHS